MLDNEVELLGFESKLDYKSNAYNKIRYLWAHRISFGGALLFLCRYFPFLSAVQLYRKWSSVVCTDILKQVLVFASPTDLHQSVRVISIELLSKMLKDI